ncbi:MAG: hypothetical protein J6B54_01875 [Clostridia bacterium]|nr:hypothetical protein [Clostridia bacterium]
MFKFSAILGGIIYLMAFGYSLYILRSQVDYNGTLSIIKFLKNIRKDNFWKEGIYTVIVAVLPLVILLGTYLWIFVDTARSVNFFYNLYS